MLIKKQPLRRLVSFYQTMKRFNSMKRISLFLLTAISILIGFNAHAATVDVAYSVIDRGDTVSPNDRFLLDFTVTNNIPSSYSLEIYTIGVDIPHDSGQEYPANWSDSTASSTNWLSLGGSNITYESNWYSNSYLTDIPSGDTLSGFIVHTGAIPTEINFYAFARFGVADYNENDAFYQGFNPGFEGTVNLSAVPVPAAAWLFGSGLVGLIGVARRKKV